MLSTVENPIGLRGSLFAPAGFLAGERCRNAREWKSHDFGLI